MFLDFQFIFFLEDFQGHEYTLTKIAKITLNIKIIILLNSSMTQQYWQRYKDIVSLQPLNRDDPFWKGVKADLQKRAEPKHHLQLYSMCKSDNPYIRQIKNSPNITTQTVAQLICRDKACELQYCLSLMKTATQNRRRIIDLKGCRQQYDTMWNCIRQQVKRVEKQQQKLRNLVHGVKVEQKQIEEKPVLIKIKKQNQKKEVAYI